MLVFDKDLFQEYCRMWEPAYYKNQWAIEWAKRNHNKVIKDYKGQFYYVDDEKGGKDLVSLKWCKEV